MALAALLALVLAGSPQPPDVRPWPIGAGPGFRLGAAPPAVLAGKPVARLRCGGGDGAWYGVHVELFVRRQVLIVPAAIGVALPFRQRFARIIPGGCTYPLRTLDPTGVVEVRRGTHATLGDLFGLWGQRLGPHRIAGFPSRSEVVAFVDGKRRRGDPRTIPLRRHAEIVLELGGYVPPHPRYLFVGGL